MVKVSYSVTGVDTIREHLNQILNKLTRNGPDSLGDSLAQKGKIVAEQKFSTAQYDGTNDVRVLSPTAQGKNTTVLRAEGSSILFIEFGAGVHYAEQHPQAAEFGMIRGTYGYHLGMLDSWRYQGDPGTNGVEDPDHPGYIKTHGNPPARAMYEASKEMRNRLAETAMEVLRR